MKNVYFLKMHGFQRFLNQNKLILPPCFSVKHLKYLKMCVQAVWVRGSVTGQGYPCPPCVPETAGLQMVAHQF